MPVYLITGANRGIGKGLVAALAKREDTTIIAAVRKPTPEIEKTFAQLPKSSTSRILTVQIDAASPNDPQKAVETLQASHRITHLDVLIANAGIAETFASTLNSSAETLAHHYQINAIGPILLLSAFLPLLKASPTKQPKFVAIGTFLASIADISKYPLPTAAYAASKTALNFFVRKIHFEEPELTSFVVNPGWVQTDMGDGVAKVLGQEHAPTTVEESVNGVLVQVDRATRETVGGTFQSYDGQVLAW